VTLEVLGEAAEAADPSEGAFDDPTFGKNDEAMQLVAFDDLDLPGAGLCDGGGEPRSLIAGIGEDTLDEGEHAARVTIEYQARSIAILHVGGMDDDVQQEAERVDEDVALATRDLLACVIARRIDRRPPFCAPLALCASMIATVGLASRPACSRTAR
jgi:hypothetical protein